MFRIPPSFPPQFPLSTFQSSYIGGRTQWGYNLYQGTLAELSVYTGSAPLSAGAVSQLATGAASPPMPPPSPPPPALAPPLLQAVSTGPGATVALRSDGSGANWTNSGSSASPSALSLSNGAAYLPSGPISLPGPQGSVCVTGVPLSGGAVSFATWIYLSPGVTYSDHYTIFSVAIATSCTCARRSKNLASLQQPENPRDAVLVIREVASKG